MVQKLIIFDFKFDNPQIEEEFNNFFYRNGLSPLFTNEHRAGSISVSYAEALSVINEAGNVKGASGKVWKRKEGASVQTLKDFAEFYLTKASDNKKYEEAIFNIIYKSRSFRGLMNNIKYIMQYIDTIVEERKFNMWNIVYYNKDLL